MSAFRGQRRMVELRRASVGSEARQQLQPGGGREGGRDGGDEAAVPAGVID